MIKQKDTKNKILDAAKTIFTSKGFDGASIDSIALEAGVTKSLLYYYFENKDAVFYEVIKKTMQNLIIRLEEERKIKIPQNREESFICGINILKNEIDVLRIALSEALKSPQKTNIIFQLPALVFDEFKDEYSFENEEKAKFCIDAINIITYISFKEKLKETFFLDDEKIYEIFNKNI